MSIETDSRRMNALDNALPTVGTDVDLDCRYSTDRDRQPTSERTADNSAGVDVDCRFGTD